MKLLKSKRAWQRWANKFNKGQPQVAEAWEPSEYPCFVYETVRSFGYEELGENYLYRSDLERMLKALDRVKPIWRCFHCNEVFYDPARAREHFGDTQCAQPLCQMQPLEVRELERQLQMYRDEDTDLHREIASLNSEHSAALMREEEKGYARGLRDGRQLGSEEAK